MGRKRFLFSGFVQKDDNSQLKQQLKAIGGVYVESESFTRDCTHVICNRLGRTQKVLGALASGAWILTPEYVSACQKAGYFVSEEKYEWCEQIGLREQRRGPNEESQYLPHYFYSAPKRCRERVAATKKGIFGTWVVAIFISDVQKNAVYRALLDRGGATVLTLDLSSNRLKRIAAKLTHIFADNCFVDKFAKIRSYGVPCISPDYIRNVLLRDLNCDVKGFSIDRYTSDQDPILRDLKKLLDNARLGWNRKPTAPTTRSTGLALLSNSFEPSPKRRRLKEGGLPLLSCSSPHKKMKKISAMRKCDSGPMDRFLTPSPLRSQSSSLTMRSAVESSREGVSMNSEPIRSSIEGSRNLPIVISDDDDDCSNKNVVAKRLFSGQISASGKGSKEVPLVISGDDGSPVPCQIEALKAKLHSIRQESLFGSKAMPLVIDSTPEHRSYGVTKRRPTLNKSVKTSGNRKETTFVVSDDSSDECQLRLPSVTTLSTKLPFNKVVAEKSESVLVIDSDDNDSENCLSNLLTLPNMSRDCCDTDRMKKEVATTLDMEKLSVPDISPNVVNQFTLLLKNDDSSLDLMCFLSFPCGASSEASIGCQAKEVTSTEAPSLFTSLLDACIDTKFYNMQTIDYVRSLLSNAYYPEPHIVSHILWTFLLNGDVCVSANAFRLLDAIVTTHPPNSAKMQLYYQRVICKCKSSDSTNSSSGWDRIIELLEFLYEEPDISKLSKEEITISPEVFRGNCEMTLKFLVRLFEMDLHFAVKKPDESGKVEKWQSGRVFAVKNGYSKLPLIARLIWLNSSADHVNSAVRRFVVCCLELAFTNVNLMIVDHCNRLLAAVAECFVLADSRVAASYLGLRPNIGCALTSLARSIVQASSDKCFKSERLHTFLSCLQPLTLRLKVSQFFLDSWTWTSTSDSQRLTMKDILSVYFPMVNGEWKPTDTKKSSPSRITPSRRSLSLSPNCKSVKTKVEFVNRRNMKGETQLHRACIRNNVEKVRSLLAVPGIDVLAADNAGWTPLHEACNYGFIECVRELLAYHPEKPIQKYFKLESEKEFKLNLLVATADGVTPLHDAVVNEHIEVVRLLLQYGGKTLLKAKTSDGKTPLDLAKTDEIVNVLTGFVNARPHEESLSQEDSFQSDANAVTVGNKLMLVALYHLVDSYVATNKFHELMDIIRSSNSSSSSSPMKMDTSVDNIRCLVDDVNTWFELRSSLSTLPSSFSSVGKVSDDFDVDFFVRGFEMHCSILE